MRKYPGLLSRHVQITGCRGDNDMQCDAVCLSVCVLKCDGRLHLSISSEHLQFGWDDVREFALFIYLSLSPSFFRYFSRVPQELDDLVLVLVLNIGRFVFFFATTMDDWFDGLLLHLYALGIKWIRFTTVVCLCMCLI